VNINDKLKEKINFFEKELIKRDEMINHTKELKRTEVELELQKKTNELERQFEMENKNLKQRNEELLLLEREKIKKEMTDIYEKQNKETCELLKTIERIKEEKKILEQDLILKKEIINYNKELSKTELELEISKKLKEKENEFNCILDEYRNKINILEKQAIINDSSKIKDENEIIIKELERNSMLQIENSVLQKELNATKEQLNTFINERNNQEIENLTKIVKETDKNKSGCRGSIGEKYFYDLVCETFCSYEGFDIRTNAKNVSHCGDHFLIFKNYTILTDTKNFEESAGVSTTDIKKLNRDMKQNQQIKIAWLVSLDKPILRHAEHPYTIEIDQENGICYVYINSLMKNENPKQLLELVWYNCDLIYKYILNNETDLDLLNKYKRKEEQIRTILDKLKKQSKERMAMINQLKDNFLETEKSLLEACNSQILDIRNIHAELLEKWWNNTLERCVGDVNLKSKAIYDKFILTNDGNGITEDIFKNLLKGLLNTNDIVVGKSEKTQYKIINWKWKV
jgi:hypothetical protein